MRRLLFGLVSLAALACLLFSPLTRSTGQMEGDSHEKKFEDFDKVVKGAKEYDGLFKLYQKDENLYLEIRPEQFNKPLLCPIAIARGMGLGGYTLNFDEQWVLLFHRVGDKVHLIRRTVHYQARGGPSPG